MGDYVNKKLKRPASLPLFDEKIEKLIKKHVTIEDFNLYAESSSLKNCFYY